MLQIRFWPFPILLIASLATVAGAATAAEATAASPLPAAPEAVAAEVSPSPAAPEAKNVILMISDGAGFNAFHAASYYEHGELGRQPYDDWPVHFGMTTYMIRSPESLEALAAGEVVGYDPEAMWERFEYVTSGTEHTAVTDSAAAATALYTGVKTTDGRMAMDATGTPLTTIAEIAHGLGKATGTLASVQASHATPGAVWAHNESRQNYAEIFNSMLFESGLNVIMGAGHPDFDNNARPAEEKDFDFVGGEETWEALTGSEEVAGAAVIDRLADFEALAAGDLPAGLDALPERVVGIPRVRTTIQYRRDGSDMHPADPFNEGVPSLVTMTRAALAVLDQNPEGYFVMIEGGAVDWANHDSNLPRMIEEQVDFNQSVAAVVEWVEAHSSWDETLVIVTSDHECGMLWGPGTFTDVSGDGRFDPETDAFHGHQPIENRGRGVVPGGQYASGGHTNALVPLWAKGPGAERFAAHVRGVDAKAGEFWGFSGAYVDITDVFHVMHAAIGAPAAALADTTSPATPATP